MPRTYRAACGIVEDDGHRVQRVGLVVVEDEEPEPRLEVVRIQQTRRGQGGAEVVGDELALPLGAPEAGVPAGVVGVPRLVLRGQRPQGHALAPRRPRRRPPGSGPRRRSRSADRPRPTSRRSRPPVISACSPSFIQDGGLHGRGDDAEVRAGDRPRGLDQRQQIEPGILHRDPPHLVVLLAGEPRLVLARSRTTPGRDRRARRSCSAAGRSRRS